MTMQAALAIDQAQKRRCLFGQYRFTEWIMPEPMTERGMGGLTVVPPLGEQVAGIRARSGSVPAKLTRSRQIPEEILSWFEHFEKKGIKAAIIKKRNSAEYAVIRQGEDHTDSLEEPEFLAKTDIVVVKKCNDFSISIREY
jgi:hypothetical protein